MELEPEPEAADSLHSLRAELKGWVETGRKFIAETHELRSKLKAAETRIAELEAQLEATSERAQWDLDWRIEAETLTRKLDTRIARAVAILDDPEQSDDMKVKRALEALR
jgi:septal ring factor EnvC (AmiA/AmiB activator)